MDTRQHLVAAWNAKLKANLQPLDASSERFAWVRQIYSRIYRFLVSCYSDGEWRGSGDDSIANADMSSNASHMPFVDHCRTTDGLAPKSPERIRETLKSIHDSNPGIATAGTMVVIEDGSWIVVAAEKKSQFARFIHRKLVASKIEARLQDRSTDMAVLVRYIDFQAALAVVKGVGRPTKSQMIGIKGKAYPLAAISLFLIISCVLTFVAYLLLHDRMQPAMPLAVCALWMAGLAGWLYLRGRRIH